MSLLDKKFLASDMTKTIDVYTRTIEIPKEKIVNDLKIMGLHKGDHVGLGISFKSIGKVIGGPETIIEALLEVVGPEGTIMVPTFTANFYLSDIKYGPKDKIFDYRSTPTYTGVVPEILRNRRDSIRSQHPSNSISAIGKLAEWLIESHDANSSPYMPYARLAEMNGKILSIGIGDRLVGLNHEAQQQAGLLNVVPFRLGVKYRDDQGDIKLFIRQSSGCLKRVHDLVSAIRDIGLVRDGKIGEADSIVAPAQEALDIVTKLLKDNPAINLCSDISCLWCRELERRKNLYGDIINPRYFQNIYLVIKIIALINWFRLRNTWVHYCMLKIKRSLRHRHKLIYQLLRF